MTIFTPLRTSVSIAAILVGTTASADVTAADVWANWKESIALYGEDGITIGSETADGGTVTVSGLSLNMSDEYSSVSADIGDIVFTENGDGTVDIQMAGTYPIMIDDGGSVVKISVSQSGMEMTASGDPDAVSYVVSADQYTIAVDEIQDGSDTIKGDMRVTANGLNGNYTVITGDARSINYAVSTQSVDLIVDIQEPGGEGTVLMSGKMDGLTASAAMTMPNDANFDEPETLFAGDFAIEGGYGLEGANYIFDINADGEQAAGSISMGLAEVSVLFNTSQVGYNVVTNDVAMNITTNELPFPIDVSLGQYGIGLNGPLAASDAPQPFSFNVNLTDLAVNDEIWMMGDPAGQLPHDPVTVKLDLSGEGRWFFDLLNPEQAQQLAMADMPGELNAVTLNDLTLSALGAAVTGTGGFTFDNTDLETFDGVPRPTGEITVNIDGANKLIDTLVAMGLIPEQEAGMGRMMMGMFARTVGDDQLTSTIEINDQGHILANGQRIQ